MRGEEVHLHDVRVSSVLEQYPCELQVVLGLHSSSDMHGGRTILQVVWTGTTHTHSLHQSTPRSDSGYSTLGAEQ